MAQAKVLSEQEFKRALAVVAKRRHHSRDRLALLLTHWAGMRVCEVAALTIDKVIGPAGEVLDEFRLDTDQTKGSWGRVVLVNQRLRREIAAYLKTNPPLLGTDPLLLSQKANRRARGFSANTLCSQKTKCHFYKPPKRLVPVTICGFSAEDCFSKQYSCLVTLR
jgi:integrase/recombinase XerD